MFYPTMIIGLPEGIKKMKKNGNGTRGFLYWTYVLTYLHTHLLFSDQYSNLPKNHQIILCQR